jgi:hypothetical protein
VHSDLGVITTPVYCDICTVLVVSNLSRLPRKQLRYVPIVYTYFPCTYLIT